MATTVTVKGQVTIPKAVREAAGIQPGDRVDVRARPEGGVIIDKDARPGSDAAVAELSARIAANVARLHRRGVKPRLSTDALMRLTRGED